MNHQSSMTHAENRPSLFLLDAMALIHRSYHAIPELTHRGQPVNAVYGFAATLLHIITTLKPTYLAVAFDEKGPTFRDEDFAAYKAQRPETPDGLKSQFPLVRRLVHEFGIPHFGIEGFEADDVIGTLAKQAQVAGTDTIIVTGDHDAYQLVNRHVQVYNVSRGIHRAEFINEDGVRGRYGFGPERMTDYKGLRGDSSDNIPGVPGVGEKTAKQLIATFSSIEELYEFLESLERIDDRRQTTGNTPEDPNVLRLSSIVIAKLKEKGISPSLYEKLRTNSDSAFLSKKLATIVTTVPITLDLEATRVKHYNEEGARALFAEWGFRSLVNKLPKTEVRVVDQQQALF